MASANFVQRMVASGQGSGLEKLVHRNGSQAERYFSRVISPLVTAESRRERRLVLGDSGELIG